MKKLILFVCTTKVGCMAAKPLEVELISNNSMLFASRVCKKQKEGNHPSFLQLT